MSNENRPRRSSPRHNSVEPLIPLTDNRKRLGFTHPEALSISNEGSKGYEAFFPPLLNFRTNRHPATLAHLDHNSKRKTAKLNPLSLTQPLLKWNDELIHFHAVTIEFEFPMETAPEQKRRWNQNECPRKSRAQWRAKNLEINITSYGENKTPLGSWVSVWTRWKNHLKILILEEPESNKEEEGKESFEPKNQPIKTEPEPTAPTHIINKIIHVTTPHVRDEILSSQSFLESFRIRVHTASQRPIRCINAHLDLLPTQESSKTLLTSTGRN